MKLIEELRLKSESETINRNNVIAEIKKAFDCYLSSEEFENYLRRHIGAEEVKRRNFCVAVQFWEYHDGCTTTNFNCGGFTWYNPENKEGYTSRKYKGVELRDINKEVCEYIANRLMARMRELEFYYVFSENLKGRLDYYHNLFYFGW